MSLVTRTKWQPSNIAIIEIEAPFLFTFLGSFFHSFAFSYSRITRCGVPSREMFFFAPSLTLLNFNQIRVLKTHSPFSYSNKHIVNIANDPDGSRPFLCSALSFFDTVW